MKISGDSSATIRWNSVRRRAMGEVAE